MNPVQRVLTRVYHQATSGERRYRGRLLFTIIINAIRPRRLYCIFVITRSFPGVASVWLGLASNARHFSGFRMKGSSVFHGFLFFFFFLFMLLSLSILVLRIYTSTSIVNISFTIFTHAMKNRHLSTL